MTLTVTQLESRDTPAAFDPTYHVANFQPIPGWTGPVSTTSADVDGNGTLDDVYAAGQGGSADVVVYSGGTLGVNETVIGPEGRPVQQPEGLGSVLFSGIIFDPSFRGGGDVSTIRQGAGLPDEILVIPGAGGGPVAAIISLDTATGGSTVNTFLCYDDVNYRGGMKAVVTPETLNGPDVIMFLPNQGGGPVVSVFDQTGQQLSELLVGAPDDRSGDYGFLPAGALVTATDGSGAEIFCVTNPDGSVTEWDWSGVSHGTFGPDVG
jgi:hypothetical protein